MNGRVCIIFLMLALQGGLTPAIGSGLLVYSNGFDADEQFGSGVIGGLSGNTTLTDVQMFAGIGDADGSFGGEFLRNSDNGNPQAPTILDLSGLPTHTAVEISFLLAIIDTWDGDVFPPNLNEAPDYFNIVLDGIVVFRESFTNLENLGSTQSYQGSPIASGQNFGFGSGTNRDNDQAYRITLTGLDHTDQTLRIEFFADGSGWNTIGSIESDESWGVDDFTVTLVDTGPGPCNLADLSEPVGLLDLADISAFIAGFVAMDTIADLNIDGLFDLTDISLFVTSFLAGCP